MADLVVHVTPGTPRPVEGLCPGCHLPSLMTVDLFAMNDGGVSPMGSWTGCVEEDCGEGS